MNAGKMRDKVTIQYPVQTFDDYNAPVTTWENFASIWAEVLIGQGREYWGAKKLNAELSGIVRVRAKAGINEFMRVVIFANSLNYQPLYTALFGMTIYQESDKAFRVNGNVTVYFQKSKSIQIFYTGSSKVLTILDSVYDAVNDYTIVTVDLSVPAEIESLKFVDVFQIISPPIRFENGSVYELHIKGAS